MKKKIILASIFILSASLLPITDQQEIDALNERITEKKKNAILEAIYATDNAGELELFSFSNYIELLENKNKELKAAKSNCKSIFEKIKYHLHPRLEDSEGLGLQAHGLNILNGIDFNSDITAAILKFSGYTAFIRGGWGVFLEIPHLVFNDKLNTTDFQHNFNPIMSKIMLNFGYGLLFMLARSEIKRIQRDNKIDALIQKNQSLITQMRSIMLTYTPC